LPPNPPSPVLDHSGLDSLYLGQWSDTIIGDDHCSVYAECDGPSILIWDARLRFELSPYLLHLTDHGSGGRELKRSHARVYRGTSVPFNAIPYGGGHIPPLSPSLGGAFQQPIGLNANYNLFGAGSLGPSSYTTSVGSMSFSLFDVFGNNAFSSAVVSAGGNPGFGQQNPVQGTIPTQGEST
jgi:hypothetical protein